MIVKPFVHIYMTCVLTLMCANPDPDVCRVEFQLREPSGQLGSGMTLSVPDRFSIAVIGSVAMPGRPKRTRAALERQPNE